MSAPNKTNSTVAFHLTRQEQFSRKELLMRTFFGVFYLFLPHAIALFFMSLLGSLMLFLTFWTLLFTGRYPRSWFDTQLGILNWNARFTASSFNCVDGYPAFGLSGQHPSVHLDIAYPETVSRMHTLFIGLLGGFVLIPHLIILSFRNMWVLFLNFLAFWSILFTKRYPEKWFAWFEESMRWGMRINAYLYFMSAEYPPFTGKEV
jgi:hypothetical protein